MFDTDPDAAVYSDATQRPRQTVSVGLCPKVLGKLVFQVFRKEEVRVCHTKGETQAQSVGSFQSHLKHKTVLERQMRE